jgi:PilZ domain
MAARTPPAPDRRQHPRFPASELNGLRGARLKYGASIDVIDLSSGGVLFETTAPLTQAATIVLEFSGPTRSVLIPSRVVRCRSLRSADYTVRSQGACAFKRPLGLRDIVTGVPKIDGDAASRRDEESGATAWQQLIARCRDGRLLSGYTNDFSPSKSYLHVAPARSATRTARVELADLEALFFLREAGGSNADRVGGDAAPYGRRVALMLPSGEQLTGSTLNYSRHAGGVFVYPVDTDFGVARVFVTQSGIHQLRLL